MWMRAFAVKGWGNGYSSACYKSLKIRVTMCWSV